MFKGRAAKVEAVLKAAGLKVTINAEKPRKGSFVVTLPGGKKIIELLDMPRPFAKLKAMDVEEVTRAALKK